MVRMDDYRLLEQVLCGELSTEERKAGGQKKHHKNQIKTVLKKYKVALEKLEIYVTADLTGRCTKFYEGAEKRQQSLNKLLCFADSDAINKT